MSILSAIKQQSGSIEDLAKLPQTMIMQMAQKKQILPEMVPVILAKKAEMIDLNLKAQAMQAPPQTQSVMEQIMAQNAQADNPQEMGRMPPAMQVPMQPPIQPPQGAADVGIASNPVPPMQMAGGGIIAFAEGDLIEDEDNEQDEYDEYVSAMQVQDYSIPITPAGEVDMSSMPTKPTKTSQMPDSGIKQLISSKAEKYKLPADLVQRIAYSESGGRPDAANPLSSAKGLFQFTNATWKGMGGKEGEQLDPEKNAELGTLFTRQNAEGLKKAFGRDPTYGEVYAANHFGLQGAKELLSLDPKTLMEKAVSSTVLKQNPYLRGRTVGDVMSQLSKKTGQGFVELAEGGAIHFASGGSPYERMLEKQKQENLKSVEEFVQGSDFGNDLAEQERIRNETINKYGPASSFFGLFKNQTDEQRAEAKKKMAEVQRLTSSNPKDTVKPLELKETPDEQIAREAGLDAGFSPKLPPAKTTSGSKKPIIKMDPNYAEIIDTEQIGNVAVPAVSKDASKPTGETPKQNRYDDYFDRLMRQEEDISKQEKNDQNMALLAAALKMYGGTSKYANENIGAGGLAGLQMMSDAQKTRAAQRAALDKSFGTGLRYQSLGENTKAQLAQNAAYNIARIDAELRNQNLTKESRDNLLGQRDRELQAITLDRQDTLDERIRKNLNEDELKREQALDRFRNMLLNPIDAKYKNNPLYAMGNKEFLANYEAEKAAALSTPEYIKRYNKAYPDDPYTMPEVSNTNILKFDSKGNPVK